MIEPDLPSAEAAREADEMEGELTALEAALARLEEGGYGRCASCGAELGDEVLAADPAATTCGAHASAPVAGGPGPSEGGAAHGSAEGRDAGRSSPGGPSGPAAG